MGAHIKKDSDFFQSNDWFVEEISFQKILSLGPARIGLLNWILKLARRHQTWKQPSLDY